MKLFTGSAHTRLAEMISEYLGHPLAHVERTRFPDGETFVKITENVRGHDVFIIQPTCTPANEHLMELLIMIDAAQRASASRITAVLPFYGYARQDRKDQPRVPITAKLVANLLTAAGADRILTMDLHSQQIQGFFDIPVDHLYASPVIVRYLRSLDLHKPVVVAPDTGGVKMAYAYRNMLEGAGIAIVSKHRKSATEVQVINVVGDVRDRDCVIVDDMTSTAGTLCSAAEQIKECGARSIIAAVSHCMLNGKGAERLKNSHIDQLITTDSVPITTYPGVPLKVLTIADLMGDAILRIHHNQSVTSLFRVD
ncbi:MAG: ribose-phosphate pyrophosphokinase [Candidatus Omnitrophota bacterium]